MGVSVLNLSGDGWALRALVPEVRDGSDKTYRTYGSVIFVLSVLSDSRAHVFALRPHADTPIHPHAL